MSCLRPLDGELLAQYWSAELEQEREPGIEEHLLACADCSRRLEALVEIAEGLRGLARRGDLMVVLAPEFVARLERGGLRARQYALRAGGSVECTITPQDDLLVARLAADLSGLEHVDALFCDASGTERGRAVDIPFRAGLTEVVFNYPVPAARKMGHEVLIIKLVTPGEQGERLIGEYRFNHSPSPV
jgi:hypothetical protein